MRKEKETAERDEHREDGDRAPRVGADISHHPELHRARLRRIRDDRHEETDRRRADGIQRKTGEKQHEPVPFPTDRRNEEDQERHQPRSQKSGGTNAVKAPDHTDAKPDRQHSAQTGSRRNPQKVGIRERISHDRLHHRAADGQPRSDEEGQHQMRQTDELQHILLDHPAPLRLHQRQIEVVASLRRRQRNRAIAQRKDRQEKENHAPSDQSIG